jgi:hypothetical protein
MGFSLIVDASQKGRLVAGQPGDNLTTFIDCIRDGLNQRITSYVVDISAEPACFDIILEPMKKLQQLVRSRGHSVVLMGSGFESGSTAAQNLQQMGIVIGDFPSSLKGSGQAAPELASGEFISEELKILFKELDTDFGGELVLPPPERVSPYMVAVQARLASILKMEESLKAEEETLLRRLTYLRKREPAGSKNMQEYNKLLEEENEIGQLRVTIGKLRNELVVAKESASTQEKVFKEYSVRLDNENRKKQETLNRELNTLKENFKKATAELEKRKKAPGPEKKGQSS